MGKYDSSVKASINLERRYISTVHLPFTIGWLHVKGTMEVYTCMSKNVYSEEVTGKAPLCFGWSC